MFPPSSSTAPRSSGRNRSRCSTRRSTPHSTGGVDVFDIGYLAAFLGGLLALISPCSALLLPSFFAYAFGGPTRLLGRTGVFFLGLAAVLVPLGAGSGALAAQLTEHRAALIVMAGWAIIALGVVQMLGGGWSVRPAARIQAQMAARGTWVATAGLGAAYGLAGFC